MRVTARGWKIFGGLTLVILLLMAWGSRQPGPPERVGQHSVLRVEGGGEVPVAATVAAFEALSHAAIANDKVGIAQLMLAGAVWSVPSGTQVLVIDMGMYRRQVRFESGEFVGQTGWVSSDHFAAR